MGTPETNRSRSGKSRWEPFNLHLGDGELGEIISALKSTDHSPATSDLTRAQRAKLVRDLEATLSDYLEVSPMTQASLGDVRMLPSRPELEPWVEMPCGCEVFLSGHANVCDACETAMRAATGDPVARLMLGESIEAVVV